MFLLKRLKRHLTVAKINKIFNYLYQEESGKKMYFLRGITKKPITIRSSIFVQEIAVKILRSVLKIIITKQYTITLLCNCSKIVGVFTDS